MVSALCMVIGILKSGDPPGDAGLCVICSDILSNRKVDLSMQLELAHGTSEC